MRTSKQIARAVLDGEPITADERKRLAESAASYCATQRRPRRYWSRHEEEQLRRLYPGTETQALAERFRRPRVQVYAKAAHLGLHKSEAYIARKRELEADRLRESGKPYRFRKGQEPANKGLRRPGWAPGRMAETQFKKGAKPQTWVPVGTEVVDPEGYRKRKVSDDRSQPSRFNWRLVHHLVWEGEHGPIPDGLAVAFRNGDKADIRLENLELITREELMGRNTLHNLPPELVQVIQLRGAVRRQIHQREEARENAAS